MRWPARSIAALAAASFTAAAGVAAAPGHVGAYRSGAPPAHSGGFGEPLCSTCHMSASDERPGTLRIIAPALFRPGEEHEIRLALSDPDMAAAGFQLTARFADGDHAGTQAGSLAAGSGIAVVAVGGIEYAGHVDGGTDVTDGTREWTLRWRAPDAARDVIFHAAANAANDDDSELGDRVYATSRTVSAFGEKGHP